MSKFILKTPQRLPYILSFSILVLIPMFVSHAMAGPIYGTSADLTGQRGIGTGLLGTNDYNNPDLTFNWVITDNTGVDGTWHYKYTFSNLPKDISHFTLDLTDDCDSTSNCVTNAQVDGIGWNILEFGDQDGIIGSVKFDELEDGSSPSIMFEFDSNRAPVYRHFCGVDGGGSDTCALGLSASNNIVFNAGLLDPDSPDKIKFIAGPNGAPVPEPSSLLLSGLGLAGVWGYARRRKKQLKSPA